MLATLHRAKSWQDLHDAAAEFGIELKPRGAGLVMAAPQKGIHVKASSVDRRLSFRALKNRFGAFVPSNPGRKVKTGKRSYRRRGLHRGEDADRLWQAYQREKTRASAARRDALAAADEWHTKRQNGTMEWYKSARNRVAEDRLFSAFGRKDKYASLDLEREKDLRRWREEALEAKQKARKDNPIPTWITFLREAASRGDKAALSILQAKEQAFNRAVTAQIGKDDSVDARELVIAELRPEVQENGQTLYRLRDGGLMTDKGKGLSVTQSSPFALLMYLKLIEARATGEAAQISGTTNFVKSMVHLTVTEDLNLRFKDPDQENMRQQLQNDLDSGRVTKSTLAYVTEQLALKKLRNDQRDYKAWAEADCGEAVFEGTATLRDGSKAMLLRKGETIFVNPRAEHDPQEGEIEQGQNITIARNGAVTIAAKASRGRR